MDFDLAAFHHRYRKRIINEWVRRLHTEVNEKTYAKRPREELEQTVSKAFDANYHVLIHGDYSYINAFIDEITTMRLEAGFMLSDVQKAFELYRKVIIPYLARETTIEAFQDSITKINTLLAYTIHRFSDLFQNMHEKKILEHNRMLEEVVRIRTAELRESERKYKTLVEEINDGYFVVQKKRIVFANDAFCQMHGYRKKEVIGEEFLTFVDSDSRRKVIDLYNSSLKKQSMPQTFEYMRLTKQGNSFPTEITTKSTQYDDLPSNIGICRDLTERVKMEKKFRDTERMAYIGQITTSLSHEIRNPLSAVTMNLQILKKNPQLKTNDRRRIVIAEKGVTRLEGILKELLDFAKPLQLAFGPTDVNQILSSCAELLEMKFEEKKLSIIVSLDIDIPKVKGDRGKLEQVFINLLLNALEASPDNGKILVSSDYRRNNGQGQAIVTIEDEGPGIPEEQVEAIFKPFVTTKSKGTGLGLTMVSRIVDAHGGRIRVENRSPFGASFEVQLLA